MDSNTVEAEDEEELRLEPAIMAVAASTPSEETTADPRIDFLDNLKTFLAVAVILYHACMGFGAVAEPYPVFVVGYFDNPWATVVREFFLEPSERYLTSLFYFVSAYFVPQSFARKGRNRFLKDRAVRIIGGALLVTLVLGPLITFWAARVSDSVFRYRPWPGAAWFLWWLFLLNLWYASTADAADKTRRLLLSKQFAEFPPSVPRRWCGTILVCGVLNKLVAEHLLGGSSFVAFMPSSEFVNNLLFYYVGLLAGENRWLDPASDDDGPSPLGERLGTNVWLFRASVLLLYGTTVAFSFDVLQPLPYVARFFIEAVVHGLWVVEFLVFLLEFFQRHVDFRTPPSKRMARWNYGAYLLQNSLVLTTPAAIFVYTYNASRPEIPVEFSPESTASATVVPMAPLVVSSSYACLVYAALCYAGACVLGRLPGLKRTPELAGEGIEYCWAMAKGWYRRQPLKKKRSKDNFHGLSKSVLAQIFCPWRGRGCFLEGRVSI